MKWLRHLAHENARPKKLVVGRDLDLDVITGGTNRSYPLDAFFVILI